MSDEFKIKINTELDGKGTQQAIDGFQNLDKATEHTNESLKEAGEAHEQTGQKAEESGKKQVEGAEHATLSHRELRESVRAVANQFGGLADVGLWLNPMTAALAILLTAVDAVKEKFSEWKQAIDAARAALQAIDDAKIKAGAEAAASFAAALGDIVNQEGKLDAAYKRGTAAIDARIKKYDEEKDALLKVEEAREKAYEAEIDRQVKLGNISKERGDAMKEEGRLALDAERGATDQAKLKFEIEQRASEYSGARGRIKSGADQRAYEQAKAGEAGPAETAAAADQRAKTISEGSVEAGGKSFKNLGELKTAAQEAKDKLQDLEEVRQNNPPPAEGTDTIGEEIKALKAQSEAYEAAIQSRTKYIENAQTLSSLAAKESAAAKNRTDIAKDQLDHDAELNRTGGDKIKTLQDQYDLQQRTNEQVQQANRQASQSRLGGEQAAAYQRAEAEFNRHPYTVDAGGGGGPSTQRPPASQPGGASDVAAAIKKAEQIEGAIQNQGHGPSPYQNTQLHSVLARIMNLLERPVHDAPSRSDRDNLQDMERRLQNLEQRANQSGNVNG
jgi:hypothetical protein